MKDKNNEATDPIMLVSNADAKDFKIFFDIDISKSLFIFTYIVHIATIVIPADMIPPIPGRKDAPADDTAAVIEHF